MGAYLHVRVHVCVLHVGRQAGGFAVCPCMLKRMRVYFYIILLLMYNTYIQSGCQDWSVIIKHEAATLTWPPH